MDLPDIPLLSMLKTRMSWLNQRQDVLSQNVSNVDTPGYVARDLKALDFDSVLKQSAGGWQMTITNPRHIAIGPSQS